VHADICLVHCETQKWSITIVYQLHVIAGCSWIKTSELEVVLPYLHKLTVTDMNLRRYACPALHTTVHLQVYFRAVTLAQWQSEN
jgi:hypothetical protein